MKIWGNILKFIACVYILGGLVRFGGGLLGLIIVAFFVVPGLIKMGKKK